MLPLELFCVLSCKIPQKNIVSLYRSLIVAYKTDIYMAGNDVSIRTVDQCLKYPTFSAFCKATSAQPECHGLDLNSFLIKPIQR
jgi:hypothetical protein